MLPFVIWRLKELRTISNPLAVGPSERRVETLLKTINLQPTLSPALNSTNTTSTFLSKAGKTPNLSAWWVEFSREQQFMWTYIVLLLYISFTLSTLLSLPSVGWGLEAAYTAAAVADSRVAHAGLHPDFSCQGAGMQSSCGHPGPGYL